MWAVTMYSFGELAGAFAAPTLIRLLSYRYAIFLGAVISPLGFLFYSGAPSAWFILIARFFIGMNSGILMTITPTYLSETSTFVYLKQKELEIQEQETSSPDKKVEIVQNENPVKDRVFAVHIIAMSSSFIIAQGKVLLAVNTQQSHCASCTHLLKHCSHHLCNISDHLDQPLPIPWVVCDSHICGCAHCLPVSFQTIQT